MQSTFGFQQNLDAFALPLGRISLFSFLYTDTEQKQKNKFMPMLIKTHK